MIAQSESRPPVRGRHERKLNQPLQPKGGESVDRAFIDCQDFDNANDSFLRIDAGLSKTGNVHAVHNGSLIQHHLGYGDDRSSGMPFLAMRSSTARTC